MSRVVGKTVEASSTAAAVLELLANRTGYGVAQIASRALRRRIGGTGLERRLAAYTLERRVGAEDARRRIAEHELGRRIASERFTREP
jgi:hypothetical protein